VKQYVGVLLTAVAVLTLLASHVLISNMIAVAIYIIGAVLILLPQGRRPVEEKPAASPRPMPTPEELKRRPAQPPELE